MQIRNVGELRAMIAALPDDMAFTVYSGSVDCLVYFDVEHGDDGDDGDGGPALTIFAEN